MDLKNLIEENSYKHIIDAVKQAGQIAINYQAKNLEHWYKSRTQPVTKADIEINDFLKTFFSRLTPNFGWLSEESEDNKSRLKSDSFWCVDPIDGTRSFINGFPEYTISIALVNLNQPVFGIIYNPKTKELFSARKDKGAYCNRKKISVSSQKSLTNFTLAISSSETKKMSEHPLIKSKKIFKIGSIAYKIALVAKGSIDVCLSFTKKSDWDLAAAKLILSESGGEISTINGKNIDLNTDSLSIPSVIATNRLLHAKLIKKIQNEE